MMGFCFVDDFAREDRGEMNAFRHEEVIHQPSVDSGEVLMSKSMSLSRGDHIMRRSNIHR